MAFYTNNTAGARGVNLKSDATAWIEPGETIELDAKHVANTHAEIDVSDKCPTDHAPTKPAIEKISRPE